MTAPTWHNPSTKFYTSSSQFTHLVVQVNLMKEQKYIAEPTEPNYKALPIIRAAVLSYKDIAWSAVVTSSGFGLMRTQFTVTHLLQKCVFEPSKEKFGLKLFHYFCHSYKQLDNIRNNRNFFYKKHTKSKRLIHSLLFRKDTSDIHFMVV